jgi:hypothetical protein
MRRENSSTKSSETTSHGLGTQMSMQATDTYRALLSPSPSDQILETLREAPEEGCTVHDVQEEKDADLERMVTSIKRMKKRGIPIPNESLQSVRSEPEMREVRDASGPGRSPFCPSPESWANATTEALAHLEATSVIPPVPKVPNSTSTLSLPNTRATSPSPVPSSRMAEAQVDILASSHFNWVAPGVSLYPHRSTRQTGLALVSKQSRSQQSNKPARYYLPEPHPLTPSDKSTEPSYGRTHEQRKTHRNRNVAIYWPITSSSSNYQEPTQSGGPTQNCRTGSDPEHSITRQIRPPGDRPRDTARSPIPGSIDDAYSRTSHLSVTRTHERQGSLATGETALGITHYALSDAPSHRPVYFSLPQHIPQNCRRNGPVAVVKGDVQQSRRDEPRREDYPLNTPSYGGSQSSGTPVGSRELYRSQRYQAERDSQVFRAMNRGPTECQAHPQAHH